MFTILFLILAGPHADTNYNGQDSLEYEQIFWQIKDAPADEEGWKKACLKMVGDYKVFLEKYSQSQLIDDAKLRIAELYQLAGQKNKAKPWLNEIVEKHPDADYYSIVTHQNNGEKTAAWALFWRGYWFKNKDDLRLLIEKYPDSPEAVREAKQVLEEWEDK